MWVSFIFFFNFYTGNLGNFTDMFHHGNPQICTSSLALHLFAILHVLLSVEDINYHD